MKYTKNSGNSVRNAIIRKSNRGKFFPSVFVFSVSLQKKGKKEKKKITGKTGKRGKVKCSKNRLNKGKMKKKKGKIKTDFNQKKRKEKIREEI